RSLVVLHASMLGEQGHVDEAVQELQALSGGKPGVEDELAIAQVYLQAKRFNDAEEAGQKALRQAARPDEQENAYFMMGSIYEREKKFDQAEETFKKVLAMDPTNGPAANYLGYMLADRGVRLEESVKYVQQALQTEPNNGAYLDSLGWAYFKMRRFDLAEGPLERAARLITDDPTILEHLGNVHLQLGKERLAVEEWERAIKEWPKAVGTDFDATEAAALQRKLDDLKTRLAKKKSDGIQN
ncbi:MAG: tetratricopeptide repeat protein, partial [Terriglobia bacterium]